MKEAHKVRIDDFKGREWTFYVTEIHAELDAYLARLKNGKYINSYNINIAENVCADLSAFSQPLIRHGLA
jgi:hypothetical protein